MGGLRRHAAVMPALLSVQWASVRPRCCLGDADLPDDVLSSTEEPYQQPLKAWESLSTDVDSDVSTAPSPLSSVPEGISPIRRLRFSTGRNPCFPSDIEDVPLKPLGVRPSESLRLDDVDSHYEIGKLLGRGTYGAIYQAECKKTKEYLALKTVHIREDKGNGDVEAEIANSSEFDHPYLLKMHAFFREDRTYHIVMDLCTGGNLQQFVSEFVSGQKMAFGRFLVGGLQGDCAKRFAWQMLNGLTFLHHHGFVHRDIKPENYLLLHKSANSPLKLADFGFATRIRKSEKLRRYVGTPIYVAPEVFCDAYDQKCDVWSLGVSIYAMCTDVLPFDGFDDEEYLLNAKAGRISDCRKRWDGHNKRMHKLALSMLISKQDDRPSAKMVLADNAWLRAFGTSDGSAHRCVVT